MLRSLTDLKQYAIHATDGDIGQVKDFYFDDEAWAIRYLVVATGTWLMGRNVLITPISIGRPNWDNKTLLVGITREQVKNSPDIKTDKPVSRQHEGELLGYYGYPGYWIGGGMWGAGGYPGMMMLGRIRPAGNDAPEGVTLHDHKKDDVHLRSCKEVTGYHIHATDGEIGHVSGMLVDERTWAIRYLIVDTSNWWMGHQVLIAPLWLNQVEWPEKKVTVRLTRQQIRDAISYDPTMKIDRSMEIDLHKHYERVGYWALDPVDEEFEAYD